MFKLEKIKFKNILNIEEILLEENRVTAILGSSGGGKTTFLKLLNNMITADQGTITYQGKDIESYDPVSLRREIVMLPQDPQIFKGTIKDNFTKTEAITDNENSKNLNYNELLQKVSLTQDLNDAADNLSGGEKQRLALARVMLLEPKVLLLDEPSSSLDKKTEEKIIKRVVDYVRKNNRTLIMVTHSSKIAEKFADKIINIENGKIIK
ncbi:MAG: ABC transporter related [Halanaerobium sp. 4-GBenrich]|jgi:putative ABC transport system ATP-binding protein|uniref:ABC transport system ATP-binding protein n=1 Tax=Halanaerobium congolense TaxID=54121 RepID=A0A1G6SEV9_9FIRM|nr:ABC transporter ATP-binding protein [Halanaerobium congolense]KXS49522.1 MAG: ABC transporter related [Halanaerobium sp. T82-1]ODS49599.1 MAG: ABC transporter related [Halanaerobium sp. 4-GBenrich]PUU88834.1 MAG: ABC transporter related [Halanaerobium sp.]PTX15615.1 putative ABC transport system ATP-binding protein [Halanaerobium congolense]PXV62723.1 putative ABC transport system ATP-binding protein [Halanaerobium congolense]